MLALASVAQAVDIPTGTMILAAGRPNPGVLPGGGWKWSANTTFGDPVPADRVWIKQSSGEWKYGSNAKIAARDLVQLPGKGGPLAVQVTRAIGLGEAAGVVARCLSLSTPVCAAGAAGALIYEALRVKAPSDVPGSIAPPGTLDYDPGQSTATVTGWFVGNNPATFSNDLAGSCRKMATLIRPNYPTIGSITPTVVPVGGVPHCYVMGQNPMTTPWVVYGGDPGAPVTLPNQCPASVDMGNPAYSIPAGATPGSDGKCPTARYNHQAIPPAQAAQMMEASAPAGWPSDEWVQATRDAVEQGRQTIQAEVQTTGPASQTGQPTTTTTTSTTGTTTTTTTTPTYNYTYNGDSITYNVTTVTVTTNGTDTTTTTTTTPENPNAQEDPEDPCVKNPDRVGCVPLGEAQAEEIPRESVPMIVTPEVFDESAGCPSPVTFDLLGQTRQLSFEPLCSAATTWVRPLVLLMAGVVGTFILVGGLKT